MKRILTFVLVLFCLAGAASAESIDLSGMGFDELVALKEQIDLAIWNSQEWQEVEVPQGVWVVGQDIPAGKWTIKAADGITAFVYWGNLLDESGTGLSYDSDIFECENLYSMNYRFFEKGNRTEVTWDMNDGDYFIVEDGIALFSPYSGKPGLGFK